MTTVENAAMSAVLLTAPEDRTAKLVYADWLDENDNPTAAARMRWWAAAQARVRNAYARPSLLAQADSYSAADLKDALDGHPDWVGRLFVAESVRVPFGHPGVMPAEVGVLHAGALGAAERFALGLCDLAAVEAARVPLLPFTAEGTSPEVRTAAWSAVWLLSSSMVGSGHPSSSMVGSGHPCPAASAIRCAQITAYRNRKVLLRDPWTWREVLSAFDDMNKVPAPDQEEVNVK